MGETPFYKTRMGQRFYEITMPELVKQLEQLVAVLERLARADSTGSAQHRDDRASS